MANFAYKTGNENNIIGLLKMYARMGNYPIDSTSVFNSKDDLENYVNETGSYAYGGQIVAVANGSVSDSSQSTDYSIYLIRSDKSIQEIGKNLTFTSVSDMTSFLAANSRSVRVGELLTVIDNDKEELYVVKADKTTKRISFDTTDIPEVSWANLNDKPDTVAGYGITDVYTKTETDAKYVESSEVVTTAEANKILKLDDSGKLPATILNGTIPIENLPHGSLERCIVVADDTARLALTKDQVQTGDTVKVTATKTMYFVADDNKLNEESGYEEYTAGSATSVPWSGIQDKPTTLSGYGITDAVNSSDLSVTAEANKLLKLNGDAKLPASITGDADTVDGKHATDFVLSEEVSATAEANKLLKLNADSKLPADITGNAATATSVEWSGVQNTPTTLTGYGITDAVSSTDIVQTAEANKVLRLDNSGKLPADITGNASTATSVEWTGVQNTPTTLEDYGITNGVNSSEVTNTPEADKLLKLGSDAKLHVDVVGNADTATNVDWSGVQNTPTTVTGYGIIDVYTTTDADNKFLDSTDVVTSATANKVLRLDNDGKLPANILNGTIPIENLPHGALERCVVVENDTARFALTADDIQNGDTVKVKSTAKMYFVADSSKLDSDDGYEIYTAGSATSVPWSGVENKPTTVAGYGITDVYTTTDADSTFLKQTEVSSTAQPNKVLKLDNNGKLPTDITGNAASANSIEWGNIANKPSSTVVDIDQAVSDKHTHANKTDLDKLTVNSDNHIVYDNDKVVAYMSDLTTIIKVSPTEPDSSFPVGGIWFDTSGT